MTRLALTALAAFALVSFPAQTQAQTYVGPVVAFHTDFDFGVGGYASFGMPSIHENVSILVDGEIFFPGDNVSFMTLAGGLGMRFPLAEQSFSPFAFAQLAYARVSVDVDTPFGDFGASGSDIGLHLGGGISFGSTDGGMRPSIGARLELGGGEGVAIFAALGFPVGGN